ncbi:MAG: Tetratricopeptide 1 repeat-containing protein, partial [Chloroflexi bacterium]|nr:Tetratricopeptide 1 repeat-containing protein [Chloroflexota bacterium]
ALLLYLSAADLRPQHAVTQVDPKRARSQLLSAIEIDPTFRAPIEMLTAELVRTPGNDTALEGLIVAMEALGAPGVSAMVTVARALENDGHAEQSASVASAVLGRHPAHVDALALAGQHAYRAGQFDRARTIIQALTAIDPESAVPYALQGNLLAAGNRIPGAAIQWELSLSYDPDQPRVLLRLGSYMATIGEHQRAYDILLRADQLGASTADSLYQLGVAAYRLGLIADATAALEMACKMNAELSYIHIMLARCYVRAGNDEKATTHDQRALQLLPSYWPSALAMGYNALNQGRLAEALQAYAQVARARPDLPEALYGLGIALVANDMLDDGLATLVRAHELQGDNVAILCALTLTYLRAGLLDEARASIYDAMFLAPNNEEVAHCIAEVHRHTH